MRISDWSSDVCSSDLNAPNFAKEGTAIMQKAANTLRILFAPVRALFVSDASAGVLLILVAVAAIVAANSPLSDGYHAFFHDALFSASLFKLNTLHLWLNDGLMAVFFFVVGLEVKREWIEGQLSTGEQQIGRASCGERVCQNV